MKHLFTIDLKTNFWKNLILLGPLLLCFFSLHSQEQLFTVNIDFGNPSYTTSGAWNNVTEPKDGSVDDLISSEGIQTGIRLAITDGFNNVNSDGLPVGDGDEIPDNASKDSFYGNSAEWLNEIVPEAGLTLYNLDPDTKYSFSFFASRGKVNPPDNRETKYTVKGGNEGEALLDATNNDSEFAVVEDIYPAEDGTIEILLEKGENNDNSYGFYYLGVMQVTYINTVELGPNSVELISPAGGESFRSGSSATIRWESDNVLSVDIDYSTDGGESWLSVDTDVPAFDGSYQWEIPGTPSQDCYVRITDHDDSTVFDLSVAPFTIFEGRDTEYKIVVLGSSTAAGAGPSVPDSAWVWRYREYMSHQIDKFEVINLAVGGFSTANILPTGNADNNITKALSYDPDAIIINLPSNDATLNRSVEEQKRNYRTIAGLAEAAGVPLWVTTPQPRNLNAEQVEIQKGMVEATYEMFGDFTIDLWEVFADDNGHIQSQYDSGDGIHLNNSAHKRIFEIVAGTEIDQYIILSHAPDLINIDFGSADKITEDWNNITDPEEGVIHRLINDRGETTNIKIEITEPFNNINSNGLKADADLGFPEDASSDSFYGNVGEFQGKEVPQAELTLSNLDPELPYSFTFLATREATDNRETKFTVEGDSTSIGLVDASKNPPETAQVENIYPASDGTITITVEPGENNDNAQNFYYLNAMKVEYPRVEDRKSLRVLYPAGGERLKAGRESVIRWESENVEVADLAYSPDAGESWITIAEEVAAGEGEFVWTIPDERSDEVLVRISDHADPAVKGESLNTFSILEEDGKHQIDIDFGADSRTTGGTWNNITDPKEGSVENLINREGVETGISISIVDPFNLVNSNGLDADEDLDIPSSASGDSFYGNTGSFGDGNTPTAGFLITGLHPDTAYDFSFFASRGGVSDNRETNYTVEGETTETVSLDAANNESALAVVQNMYPKEDGTIIVSLEAGENNTNSDKFYYLGAMRIVYAAQDGDIPSSAMLTPESLNIVIFPNPARDYLSVRMDEDISVREVIITDVMGRMISREKRSDSRFFSGVDISDLSSGIYLLTLNTNKGMVTSKIVVQK